MRFAFMAGQLLSHIAAWGMLPNFAQSACFFKLPKNSRLSHLLVKQDTLCRSIRNMVEDCAIDVHPLTLHGRWIGYDITNTLCRPIKKSAWHYWPF